MSTDDQTAVAKSWLRYQRSRDPNDFWSLDALDRLLEGDALYAWDTITALCNFAESQEELCAIGAGPVEDLMRKDGETTVKMLERLIDTYPKAIVIAACVWAMDSPWRWRIDLLLQKHEQPRL